MCTIAYEEIVLWVVNFGWLLNVMIDRYKSKKETHL